MSKVKVAVIGVGQMGNNHARVYSQMPQVDLVAIADSNNEIAVKASKQWNTKSYKTSLDLLRNEKPDIVSLAVPTHLHYRIAKEVISHKCHLLLEKPISDNELDARKIISYAKKNKVHLMIGHIERFNPAIQALQKQLCNKELGKLYYLEALRSGPAPIQFMNCGVTLDIAVHDLDIFQFVTGNIIEYVNATTSKIINEEHEDWMHGTLFFDKNLMATIHCDWLSPIKRRQLSVFGAAGTFMVDYIAQSLVFHKDDVGSDGSIRRTSIQHAIKRREPLVIEIETFIKSILNHKKSPVSGEDGLVALEIANRILFSAKRGKTIAVRQKQSGVRVFNNVLTAEKHDVRDLC